MRFTSLRFFRFLAATVIAGILALSFGYAEETPPGEALFNGTDLSGWKGDPESWSVVDGVVVGLSTADKPLPYNQFLIWKGEPVEDFVLTVDLRLTSDGNNSGIQYRSRELPDKGDFVISGYQCDVHPAIWANGMVYEERGRGVLGKRGTKVKISSDGKPTVTGELPMEPEFDLTEWNTYRITAKGNHLIHEINGVRVAEAVDFDESGRALSGLIAFQLHKGSPMKIEIRNAILQRLPK
ncbi:MAG: DUF1080 domain-containing protein [Verrucomicrobiota bacterium]